MGDPARDHWTHATDTFKADDDYYRRAALCIRETVTPHLKPTDRVLDIGCGDGLYTQVLAEQCGHVDGFDLSPHLIDAAARRDVANVSFEVGDALSVPDGTYDLVSCMGVLVCIREDADFALALSSAAEAVRPGGLLLLRETFSGWGRRLDDSAGHPACYRRRSAYLSLLTDFSSIIDVQLAAWSRRKRRTNHLWLLRRALT